jgi:hypothetical protein
MMAALALTMTACSKDDDGLTPQPAEQQSTEQTTGRGIPFTATISIGEGGMTRALADGGTTLTASWAEGEKVALIHNGVSDEMEVTSVSGGKATITGDITGSPSDGDDVTIIYPATAAKGTTGKVKGNLLKRQEGTLAAVSEKYDVRKGSGTLTVTGESATLTDDVEMANQYAVWKLTLPANARNLCILADNEAIAGATLIGEQGSVFTVAVPEVDDKTITVVASDDDNNCYYYKKDGINLAAGKYYRSAPAMSPVGTESTNDPRLVTGDYSSESDTWVKNFSGNKTKTFVFCGLIVPQCVFLLDPDDVTIILMGTNSLNTSGKTGAFGSMVVGGDKTLTITGTGSLTAKGGIDGPCFGAYKYNSTDCYCGNIIISGGILDLTGGKIKNGTGAAAIGTGHGGTCGNITITEGVTRLTATKIGSATHSIGTGTGGSCGTVTIGGTVYWDGSSYQNGGDTYLTQSTLIYEP